MSSSIDIGISEDQRRQIADGLGRLLADTWVLYGKTHGFHWNVTGPMFNSLHEMFGDSTLTKLASLNEASSIPAAMEMVQQLMSDHEAVARTARSVFDIADAANDQPTADLLTQRLQVHEKTAWMLRSLLQS